MVHTSWVAVCTREVRRLNRLLCWGWRVAPAIAGPGQQGRCRPRRVEPAALVELFRGRHLALAGDSHERLLHHHLSRALGGSPKETYHEDSSALINATGVRLDLWFRTLGGDLTALVRGWTESGEAAPDLLVMGGGSWSIKEEGRCEPTTWTVAFYQTEKHTYSYDLRVPPPPPEPCLACCAHRNVTRWEESLDELAPAIRRYLEALRGRGARAPVLVWATTPLRVKGRAPRPVEVPVELVPVFNAAAVARLVQPAGPFLLLDMYGLTRGGLEPAVCCRPGVWVACRRRDNPPPAALHARRVLGLVRPRRSARRGHHQRPGHPGAGKYIRARPADQGPPARERGVGRAVARRGGLV